MKIAACWITQGDNELEKLKKSVASVRAYVDSIHITANGKHTTKTEKWCQKEGIDYSFLPWNKDFGQQRNFNFARAPKDTDYIFWLDYDDVLIGGEFLRSTAEIGLNKGLDLVYLEYWYACQFDGAPSPETLVKVQTKQARERLIKPVRIVWKKRIHESPNPIDGIEFKHASSAYHKETNPIVVLHTGAHQGEPMAVQEARMKRNQEILELELADERKAGQADPRTILYLMKIYAELSDPAILEECYRLGEEYLTLSGWDQERMTCRTLMGRCQEKLGDPYQAVEEYREAVSEYSFIPKPYIHLASALCSVRKYREADHWIRLALSMERDSTTGGVDAILEDELLTAQVLTRLHWEWPENKKVRKAAQFAEKVAELVPHEINIEQARQLKDIADLDVACEHVDHLSRYLVSIGEEKAVLDLLQSLPQAIKSEPFAVNLWKKYSNPRIWGAKEIAYFCGPGYEKWDATNLTKGIGGSETAVIELAKEWVKLGYKVTIYGDPLQPTVLDNVVYLPHFHFNPKDKFNILILWRSPHWLGKVSAKKIYVDLHDVASPVDYLPRLDQFDKLMVKSQAHQNLLPGVPASKIHIISNGIRWNKEKTKKAGQLRKPIWGRSVKINLVLPDKIFGQD